MTLGEYGENDEEDDGEDDGELICRENISRHKPFGNTCFYLRGQATPSRSPSGVVQGQYVGGVDDQSATCLMVGGEPC